MKSPVATRSSVTTESYFQFQDENLWGVVFRGFLPEDTDWTAFLADLDENPGEILRKGGGQGITSFRTISGRETYVKRYLPSGFFRRLRDWSGNLRATAEWRANLNAESLGIRTGTVAAAISVRQGMQTKHYFISFPCQGTSVSTILKGQPDSTERTLLVNALACFVAVLHHRGFYHAHLHLAHIFADEALNFELIDLEASKIQLRLRRSLKSQNLSQIQKDLRKLLPSPEVKRFQRRYRQALRAMESSPASERRVSHTSAEVRSLLQEGQ